MRGRPEGTAETEKREERWGRDRLGAPRRVYCPPAEEGRRGRSLPGPGPAPLRTATVGGLLHRRGRLDVVDATPRLAPAYRPYARGPARRTRAGRGGPGARVQSVGQVLWTRDGSEATPARGGGPHDSRHVRCGRDTFGPCPFLKQSQVLLRTQEDLGLHGGVVRTGVSPSSRLARLTVFTGHWVVL